MVSVLKTVIVCTSFYGFALGRPLAKRDLALPNPHADSFYAAPDNLSSLQLGEVYNTRTVHPEIEYIGAESTVQIAYRTRDMWGNVSHTVATVMKPYKPDSNAKLFSYQVWEDADNIDCSPSYSIYGGLLTPDGLTTTIDAPIYAEWALSKGYYIVFPDHEGPLSTFFAGFNEAYAGIDGIRAAQNHLGLARNTATTIYGYSGGAHASVWMTELVDSYAPELNIVGSAHGGTPVDPLETVEYLDGKTFSGFVAGALGGLLRAYPDLMTQLYPKLSASFQSDLNTLWSNDTCIITEVLDYGNTEFHTMTSLSDLYSYPPLVSVFENESLLKNYSSHPVATPKFPRYIFHAKNDEVIPDSAIRQYVSQQCGSGANIQFVEWPGGGHLSTDIFGMPDAMQFLQQAYAGETPNLPCGSASKDPLTVTSVGVGSIIGDAIVDAIKALNNTLTPLGRIDLYP